METDGVRVRVSLCSKGGSWAAAMSDGSNFYPFLPWSEGKGRSLGFIRISTFQ